MKPLTLCLKYDIIKISTLKQTIQKSGRRRAYKMDSKTKSSKICFISFLGSALILTISAILYLVDITFSIFRAVHDSGFEGASITVTPNSGLENLAHWVGSLWGNAFFIIIILSVSCAAFVWAYRNKNYVKESFHLWTEKYNTFCQSFFVTE